MSGQADFPTFPKYNITQEERQAVRDWQVYLCATLPHLLAATVMVNESAATEGQILVMVEQVGMKQKQNPSALMGGTDNLWEWVDGAKPQALADWSANGDAGAGYFANEEQDFFLYSRQLRPDLYDDD